MIRLALILIVSLSTLAPHSLMAQKIRRSRASSSKTMNYKEKPSKQIKLRAFAKGRLRNAKGQFLPLVHGRKALRGAIRLVGRANPTNAGQSAMNLHYSAPTPNRTGTLRITIPEKYVGASKGGSSRQIQIFARDIHGERVVISGTLKESKTRSSFASATFVGQVPRGVVLSQNGLALALHRSQLHVNPFSLKVNSSQANLPNIAK